MTIIAKVTHTERVGTSHYGNPSYDITLVTRSGDELTLRTSANVMFAYACDNLEYRDEWHEYVLTKAGRIRFARKLKGGA